MYYKVRKRDDSSETGGLHGKGGDSYVKEISTVYRRVLRRVFSFREVLITHNAV